MKQVVKQKNYLWINLRDLPYFRALLRAVEAREYEGLELPAPILDVGCGDGHFVKTTFDLPVDVGIDPWADPVHQASRLGGYRLVIQGAGDQLPFADGYFGSAMSNSVLEHIPQVDHVLLEIARVLRPGAPFIFCVPNHNFLSNLSISNSLDKMGFHSLADTYRAFFNRISRHYHCDAPEVWRDRLERACFKIDKVWHYFSPQALMVLEWGHYLGLPSLVTKKLFGKWILVPSHWNLVITEALTKRFYLEDREQVKGSYSFYIAHRM